MAYGWSRPTAKWICSRMVDKRSPIKFFIYSIMKTSKKTFRRDFLKKSLLAAAGVSVVPGLVLAKGVGLNTFAVPVNSISYP